MTMATATARSVLARVARVGHPASQTLLRVEGNPTAGTLSKRFLPGFKGRRYFSIWDKLPTSEFLEPVGPILMLFAFTFGMGTMIPYAISSGKKAKEGKKELEEWKAECKKRLDDWKAHEADLEKSH